jgi:hypothetical protein
MGKRTLVLLVGTALAISACGAQQAGSYNADEPLLQIRSEGGFVPLEWSLGQGPTYTLLGDGRVISQGPVILIYPGPLLPNYQISQIAESEFDRILDLVDEIGLPEMESEYDDSAASFVADATTEVITFWDNDSGLHQYSVYALGIEPDTPNRSTAAAYELLTTIQEAVANSTDTTPYEPEEVRVLAGITTIVSDLEDIRPWPLEGEDPSQWEQLEIGWSCEVFGPEILETFADASQVTQWLHPDPMMDAPPFALLVRPLHPGEEACEIPSPQI